MNLFTAIRSEWQKVKHTSFWTLHIIMSLAGALLFTLYFNLYDSVEDERKLQLILELTAMTFPLLISAAAGLNLQLEERAAHMQMLLFSSGRRRTFLGKLIALYGAARYIPFAWGMNWIHDVLNHTFLRNLVQWIVAGCLTAGLLLAAVQWFAHWEGRKHEE